jgi:hypothetical protein
MSERDSLISAAATAPQAALVTPLLGCTTRACERTFPHVSHDWQGNASEWFKCIGARRMLADGVSPRFAESDYEEVLRGVLAERDLIGDWLQRYIDADYKAGQEGGSAA